ncbi:unnamed protein product [Urochloa humidicola]
MKAATITVVWIGIAAPYAFDAHLPKRSRLRRLRRFALLAAQLASMAAASPTSSARSPIDMNKRAGELTPEELERLMTVVDNPRQSASSRSLIGS